MRVYARGLSPLARGNHCTTNLVTGPTGPIPARAGQPMTISALCHPAWAYPRSRGATGCKWTNNKCLQGLSPLARGNRREFLHFCIRSGPIPARAGQPYADDHSAGAARAYPRSRGATVVRGLLHGGLSGLSPLARGNLRHCPRSDGPLGPIPARAGQPTPHKRRCRCCTAYPRSRGATRGLLPCVAPVWGLSPLARGNQLDAHVAAFSVGPIPARAGQPPKHPAPTPGRSGLSPLARGNRHACTGRGASRGPIPARAGQPPARTCRCCC